jgi:hypothetical protein
MKKLYLNVLTIALIISAATVRGSAQTWDYIDVPQGYETLNLAVEGDTTAAGLAKSLNRVYRLERGGVYLLNGHIVNIKGAPLRVWAADGPGPKPMIIMAVDQTGANDDFAYCEGPAHFKNLYISGIDDIGKQDRYTMAVYGDSNRVILEGIHIDHSRQSHVRSYGTNQKLYFLNCEFRNSIDLATPSNGRFYDGRGLVQDTMMWQNCTFYVNSQRMFRTDGAVTKNIIFDHNTFYLNAYGQTTTTGWKLGGGLEIRRGLNVRITNNIFQDFNLEGLRHASSLNPLDRVCTIFVDSTGSSSYPESSRNWLVQNNSYGLSPGFKAFFAERTDTVKAPVFISLYGDSIFFRSNPNFVQSNNFEEYQAFADAPSPDSMLKYVAYRFKNNFLNTANPDPRADRNGIGSLTTMPLSFGIESDPYNFDYPTSARAFTAGDGGFPLGDLNWFPTKKAQWETWVTGVEEMEGVVTSFEMNQNYPNPFNPSTTITFTLPKATRVMLAIYNTLGQRVTTLLDNRENAAGRHSAVWDGRDASGNIVASGIYFYQLSGPDFRIARKMVLTK